MAVLSGNKREIICRLQRDILLKQGLKPPEGRTETMGLGPVESAFPGGVFPIGSMHEFISTGEEETAASSGFITGLLASLMRQGGACLWISVSGTVFPPALKAFGVEPDRILFIGLRREKDVLWAMEEALKCPGLAAVVAEVREVDFTRSRRLQLAVGKSKVTGLVLRKDSRGTGATACAARWRITPLPSVLEEGMPGIGFPRWQVELLKVRNGNPGTWQLEWSAGRFVQVTPPVGMQVPATPDRTRRAGLQATLKGKAAVSAAQDRKTG